MYPSAGCRVYERFDDLSSANYQTVVLYPGYAPEQTVKLGQHTMDLAMDAPVAAGRFPLVAISHGTGGSHLAYRDLGRHLARHGFVIAMPEHPRNNRNNNELGGTAANLTIRPRHLTNVMDWMFASDVFGGCLVPGVAAIIGHSLGGYTALAMAGGRPTAFAHETPDRKAHPIDVTPDERVKALVLLAPATPWFMEPESLREVQVPILMLTGEKDPHTPAWHGEIVRRGIPEPGKLEHRVIENAGHFSFLTPFPAAMTKPAFPPSQDPPGFDRAHFQEQMNADIAAFLKSQIGSSLGAS